MKRYQLDSVNVIRFKVLIGLAFAACLSLWGWLLPEMSFPFLGRSITFSIRMPLLAMAGILLLSVVTYTWREVTGWLNHRG